MSANFVTFGARQFPLTLRSIEVYTRHSGTESPPKEGAMSSNQVLEVKIVRIHHGQRDAYHDYMREGLARVYEAQGLRYIYYGPSLHDEDSYFVIRAHPSVADRAERLDAVYGSQDWLMNHEEKVLAMVESMDTALFDADDQLIEALKKNFETAGTDAVLSRVPK
jgi:hypothetical protein